MEFDIDVSGKDILSKNYVICIASKDGKLIKGFKFNNKLVQIIASKYGQELYKYKKSVQGKVNLQIRIYSIVIYYLFKSIKIKNVSLNICRDFYGHNNEIVNNLNYFLKGLLKLNILDCQFKKLDKNSFADNYAYLMAKDSKNKMKTYVTIRLDDFEKFLKK
ncbi:hypothetical protein J4223_00590 [Candidatus Woesearchaeota archaeon]|nr:hypothetical protein [Candidatus Woesearchaeota archaeon]